MSNSEIWDWLGSLSPKPYLQARVVRDLINHAGTDHMSAEDRVVCARAMKMLAQARLKRMFGNVSA